MRGRDDSRRGESNTNCIHSHEIFMTLSPGASTVVPQSFNLQSGAFISSETQQRRTASPAQPQRECHIFIRAQVLHTRYYTRARTHTPRHLYFILFQAEPQHLACADKCWRAAAGRLHSWGRFLPAVPRLHHHHHYLWRWRRRHWRSVIFPGVFVRVSRTHDSPRMLLMGAGISLVYPHT